jgi:NAD(P)H-hydrate epimerase
MEILTSAEMKKVDEETIDRFCPGIELMERAGMTVADFILGILGEERPKISIFAGSGNNGGDALVTARYLTENGCACSVHLLKHPEKFSMDSLKNYERLAKIAKREKRLKEFSVERPDWPELVDKDLADAELVIDGLFGTGIKGALRGKALEVVRVINRSGLPIVSIDMPSGVDGDSGEVPGEAVKADYTVTIGRPKLGLFFHPGKSHVGELIYADIGFPEDVVEAHSSGIHLLDDEEAALRLPPRDPDTYKYECGTLLIVAGSRTFTGAALLSAEAALRGGCGMVYLAVPAGIRTIMQAGIKEAIVVPLPETGDGTVSPDAFDVLSPFLERADALAVGPGLGRNEATDEFVRTLVAKSEKPVVLDADGITAYRDKSEMLSRVSAPLIITPHSGELARLLSREIPSEPSARIDVTREIAGSLDLVLLHKGAPTLISSPDGEVLVGLHGNSALATGGTGDVLTGVAGSFLAQGASAVDAAALAAFLQGKAGELASEDWGLRGVKAGDLLWYLGSAMAELEEEREEMDRYGSS